MSSPIAKRRRTEATSSTLTKPFKSPVRKLLDTPGTKGANPPVSGPSLISQPAQPSGHNNGLFKTRGFNRQPRLTRSAASPAETATSTLLKEQRAIEKEIRETRQELDTLRQANRIKQKNEDEEMLRLCEKWKTISRATAEALFSVVKDRVNRMGGPAAWHEMQRRNEEWKQGAFDEPDLPVNDDDDENTSNRQDFEQRDLYAEYDIEPEVKKSPKPAEEEEVFTMEMMLKAMKIDLDLIGYDKVEQRWSD